MKQNNHRFVKSFWLVASLAVFLMLSSGCAHQVLVAPRLADSLSTDKIKLDVGLHLSDAFKNYKVSESRGGDTWNYDNLGEASSVQLQLGLTQMFQNVELVLETPPFSNPKLSPLSVVFEPTIERFDFDIPLTKFQVYPAKIYYKIIAYDSSGKIVLTRTVEGVGDTKGSPGFDFAANPAKSATKAVEEGCKRVLEAILSADEMKALINK